MSLTVCVGAEGVAENILLSVLVWKHWLCLLLPSRECLFEVLYQVFLASKHHTQCLLWKPVVNCSSLGSVWGLTREVQEERKEEQSTSLSLPKDNNFFSPWHLRKVIKQHKEITPCLAEGILNTEDSKCGTAAWTRPEPIQIEQKVLFYVTFSHPSLCIWVGPWLRDCKATSWNTAALM